MVIAQSEAALAFEIERRREPVAQRTGDGLEVLADIGGDATVRFGQVELGVAEQPAHDQRGRGAGAGIVALDHAGVNAALGEVL